MATRTSQKLRILWCVSPLLMNQILSISTSYVRNVLALNPPVWTSATTLIFNLPLLNSKSPTWYGSLYTLGSNSPITGTLWLWFAQSTVTQQGLSQTQEVLFLKGQCQQIQGDTISILSTSDEWKITVPELKVELDIFNIIYIFHSRIQFCFTYLEEALCRYWFFWNLHFGVNNYHWYWNK